MFVYASQLGNLMGVGKGGSESGSPVNNFPNSGVPGNKNDKFASPVNKESALT